MKYCFLYILKLTLTLTATEIMDAFVQHQVFTYLANKQNYICLYIYTYIQTDVQTYACIYFSLSRLNLSDAA